MGVGEGVGYEGIVRIGVLIELIICFYLVLTALSHHPFIALKIKTEFLLEAVEALLLLMQHLDD